jgi:hypothetical protein
VTRALPLICTACGQRKGACTRDCLQQKAREVQEARERVMFGCTAAAIDEALAGKEPRDIAMYAMGTLSNAQELFQRTQYDEDIEWTVPSRNANKLRQLLNIAKYAIDKAVPR